MAKKQFNKQAQQRWRTEMTDRFLDEVEEGRLPYVSRMLSKYPSLAYATRIEVVRINDYDEDYVEKSALHIAATHDRGKIVALLLEAGARVNTTAKDGRTPLHEAVYGAIELEGHADERKMIRLLLEKGANIDTVDGEGFTPANSARSEGKRDLANFIEDYALQVVEMNEMEVAAREQKALNVLREGSIKPITARKPIQFRRP